MAALIQKNTHHREFDMTQEIALKLIDECERLFNEIPAEKLSVWTIFANINSIASQYDSIDCLIHINFANGQATQGMCILTDWKPGAVALQSDQGELPKPRIIFPEEYVDFMNEMENILEVKYPGFPEEQE